MKPAIGTTMRYERSNTANFETCLITSTTIDAPLNLIWSIHADIDAWRRWNPHVSTSEMCQGHQEKRKWTRVGTEFYWKKWIIPIPSVVTEVEPLSRIAWVNSILGFKFKFISKYVESYDGTQVHVEALAESFLSRLFHFPLQVVLSVIMQTWLMALKAESERHTHPMLDVRN